MIFQSTQKHAEADNNLETEENGMDPKYKRKNIATSKSENRYTDDDWDLCNEFQTQSRFVTILPENPIESCGRLKTITPQKKGGEKKV